MIIGIVILGRIGSLLKDIYLAQKMGAMAIIPPDFERFWSTVSIGLGGIVNVGSAIWLYVEAKAESLKSWVWSIFGLFFGLIGIIVFYAIQIYTAKKSSV